VNELAVQLERAQNNERQARLSGDSMAMQLEQRNALLTEEVTRRAAASLVAVDLSLF
jgi:hypothetical protein